MPPASRIMLVAFLLATASTMAAADVPGADRRPPRDDPIAVLLTASWRRAEDGDQFTDFCDLLQASRVDTQIRAQLRDSSDGVTILAPTNAAFDGLKPGTITDVSNDEFLQMMRYCVLPRFYSPVTLYNLNGEVISEASGGTGPYKYNVSSSEVHNQVNFSTGVKGNDMRLGGLVWDGFPLAIYSVDKVPLPFEIFGPRPPPTKSKPKKKSAEAPTPESQDTKNAASSYLTGGRRIAALGVLAGAVLLRVLR